MKKRLFRIMILTLTFIFILKIAPVSSLGSKDIYMDNMGSYIEEDLDNSYENNREWIHLYGAKNNFINIKKNYRFGMVSKRAMGYLPTVISETGDFRGTLRNRIDRNKEMLAGYYIDTGEEDVISTSVNNQIIITIQEDIIAIVEDIPTNHIIINKQKRFLIPEAPSILKNLIEGNCIGVRSPPAFKDIIYLI